MEKLLALGVSEVCFYHILYYELDGTAFYELKFTPSYDGVGVAYEFGEVRYGEVYPHGRAWVTAEGVASIEMSDFLGTVMEEKAENVLDFSKVTEILETYLKSGTIRGNSEMALTKVELVYYPTYSEPSLSLTPAWHLCVPLNEYEEGLESGGVYQEAFQENAAWNLYIDAVTGKLLKVE